MNNLIKKIEITNFRSIKHCSIDCSQYNLFCGINDVGKSNILKALNLFFNRQTDFDTPFDFASDYNKFSLAEAQSSKKMKQTIKIKVTFRSPESYKNSLKGKDFYIEKIYDRIDKTGNGAIKYSEESKKARTAISRINNKIHYVYIPALKSKIVINYLLGLLGEQQLIKSSQIDSLNKSINESTKNLSVMLKESSINVGAVFGLPTLLSDFWQQLSVGTNYEYLNKIEANLTSKRQVDIKLNSNYYKIPLMMRGDGIKSMFLPPILEWLQSKNRSQIFIWGMDEPENSLEFRKAESLSELFCDKYAKRAQIFAASHSMAFINPHENAQIKPVVFRVLKTEYGETTFRNIDDLMKDDSSEKILEEIGVLEIQKELISKFRNQLDEKDKENRKLNEIRLNLEQRLKDITKPLLITEGKSDWKHLKRALQYFQQRGEFNDIDIIIFENDEDLGDSNLKKTLEAHSRIQQAHKIIGMFDCDQDKNGSNTYGKKLKEKGGIIKLSDDVIAFCIDTPNNRSYLSNGISIEFLYNDEDIKREDSNHRRLYISSEFDSIGNLAQDDKIKVKNYSAVKNYLTHDTEKIIDSEVYNTQKESLALSKDSFANNILNDQEGFKNINFDNFKKTFVRLRKILKGEFS